MIGEKITPSRLFYAQIADVFESTIGPIATSAYYLLPESDLRRQMHIDIL